MVQWNHIDNSAPQVIHVQLGQTTCVAYASLILAMCPCILAQYHERDKILECLAVEQGDPKSRICLNIMLDQTSHEGIDLHV